MKNALLFNFKEDRKNNTITVEREFAAPLDLVWAAWTEADILDRWWAPEPYRTITRSMDFREGGRWHYYMQGPEGDVHWCLLDYDTIRPKHYYAGSDAFCDEHGVMNTSKPKVRWENTFNPNGDTTTVTILMKFESLENLETIIQMGMKEGFTAGMENLDRYIAAQFHLRKQNRPANRTRTCTYLNFPGTTEEAFLFYRSVFGTEFINGIHRFGEVPADPDSPPMADNLKRMVLHIELPLLGDHVLMGTDALKEMGFTVTPGNNMHISLEPESRAEADRIFNLLSDGGKVVMPIQDMFWGAYYGSFTDRYGINWMVNYAEG